jgi:hypothetical protein
MIALNVFSSLGDEWISDDAGLMTWIFDLVKEL